MPSNNSNPRNEALRALSYAFNLAISIISCVAVGVFMGKVLDKLIGTAPALSIVFSLLGVAAAVLQISRSGGSA